MSQSMNFSMPPGTIGDPGSKIGFEFLTRENAKGEEFLAGIRLCQYEIKERDDGSGVVIENGMIQLAPCKQWSKFIELKAAQLIPLENAVRAARRVQAGMGQGSKVNAAIEKCNSLYFGRQPNSQDQNRQIGVPYQQVNSIPQQSQGNGQDTSRQIGIQSGGPHPQVSMGQQGSRQGNGQGQGRQIGLQNGGPHPQVAMGQQGPRQGNGQDQGRQVGLQNGGLHPQVAMGQQGSRQGNGQDHGRQIGIQSGGTHPQVLMGQQGPRQGNGLDQGRQVGLQNGGPHPQVVMGQQGQNQDQWLQAQPLIGQKRGHSMVGVVGQMNVTPPPKLKRENEFPMGLTGNEDDINLDVLNEFLVEGFPSSSNANEL